MARRIRLELTSRELHALFLMVDNSWSHGEWVSDYLRGQPGEQAAAAAAYTKLSAAWRAGAHEPAGETTTKGTRR